MKLPLSWLREYVALRPRRRSRLAATARLHLAARSIGSSRAACPTWTATSALFLVGKVLEAGKHPNADRLQLCHVDVGEGEPRQIVCGAWNFGAGATVAVALPGACSRRPRAARRGEAPR